MQSFLIIGSDQNKIDTTLEELYQKYEVFEIDRTILSTASLLEETKPEKLSIGIAEIKKIQKKLFLKPIKSKMKAVTITEAEHLTPQAQNALLKTLEEPPDNTIIILVAPSEEVFLPTILSRCTILTLNKPNINADQDDNNLEDILQKIPDWEIGQRLKQAEILAKERQTAILWITSAILSARSLLRHSIANDKMEDISTLNKTIKTLQSYGQDIKTTNVNLRLALENLFLSL